MTTFDSRDMPAMGDPEYALSSAAEHEHKRLSRQSDMHEPFTRRLLARAGIEPGMRVLDVGCGPGDVSFLLSELVGAGGSVVGVERDEQALRGRAMSALEGWSCSPRCAGRSVRLCRRDHWCPGRRH